MSGGNIWIQMGDEETPDPGNLTHLASDREQETGDRRGLVTLVTYTRLLDFGSWENGDYFPFLYPTGSLSLAFTLLLVSG